MTCVETTCTLFRTMNSDVMPAYKIGIYNSKNVLQGSFFNDVNAMPYLSVYTKIANDGSELPDSAQLGSSPKDWACTKDNKTGLIWEVKTDDGSMRDKDEHYSFSDLEKFVTTINTVKLCSASDWRMPTKDELLGIVKAREAYHPTEDYHPKIDTTYFPDTDTTPETWFWSSSSDTDRSLGAWIVNFYYGSSDFYIKSDYFGVRLVRDAQ